MNTSRVGGNRIINGTFGTLWIDGEEVFEVNSFEAKVTFNREDVGLVGNLDVDSKIISQSGEGSFTIRKVFSRGLSKFIQMTKEGKDIRSQFIGKLADPDTVGGQSERVAIDNVWFNEFTLLAFERESLVENEFPFGFTPSSIDMIDEITF